MAHPGSGRRRRLVFGVLVALAVFGTAEVALRLLLGPPPPPVKAMVGVTGRKTFLRVADGVVTFPHTIPEPTRFQVEPSGPRVVFLGGSTLANDLYPDRDAFPEMVGKRMGVEAINLGAAGMNTFDLVVLTRELAAIPHDVLVVYEGHNDFGSAFFQKRYGSVGGSLAVRAQALLERLRFYCVLRRAVSARPRMVRPGDMPDRPMTPEAVQSTLRHLLANLRRIAWLSARQDVPVLLITPVSSVVRRPMDHRNRAPGAALDLWTRGLALASSDPTEALRLLRAARDADPASIRTPSVAVAAIAAFEAEGVTVLDAEGELPREPGLDTPADALFDDGLHLSDEGHARLADLVVPRVEALLRSASARVHQEPPGPP